MTTIRHTGIVQSHEITSSLQQSPVIQSVLGLQRND